MQKYVDGVLVDMTPAEIAERQAEEALEASKDRRPLAMGKDLVKYLNDFNSGMNAEDIKALLKKLVVTYVLLENRPFNPFTQETFAFVLADLDIALNGNAQLVKQICLGLAKDKRFAKK